MVLIQIPELFIWEGYLREECNATNQLINIILENVYKTLYVYQTLY